jgi:hypothetical protein
MSHDIAYLVHAGAAGRFLVKLAPGRHGPRHPGQLVGERDRRLPASHIDKGALVAIA